MRVLITLTVCLLAACSSHAISSLFVAQSANEIDMLNLVEAPPGHLSGIFVVSSLTSDGQRNKDAVQNVSGSLYKGNVSLQIDNGIIVHPTNVVGTVSGNAMTLTFGNNTVVFHAMSQQKYAEALTALDKTAETDRQIVIAKNAVINLQAKLNRLNDDLQGFVKWSNERIAHVSNVEEWYAKRIASYQKCLDTIRPLAARHVPSWKWQNCVFAIDNDEYVREQSSKDVADYQANEHTNEQALNLRISNVSKQADDVVRLMEPVCPVSKDVEACKESAKKFTQQVVAQIEQGKPATEYRAILPKIRDALDTDMQIRADGDKQLSAIASEVDDLYRAATHSPSS